MNQEDIVALKNGSATLTVSMGTGTWIGKTLELIGTNAATIGAICSIISLCAYLYFQYRNDKNLSQAHKNTKKIKEQEELIKNLHEIVSKINERKR